MVLSIDHSKTKLDISSLSRSRGVNKWIKPQDNLVYLNSTVTLLLARTTRACGYCQGLERDLSVRFYKKGLHQYPWPSRSKGYILWTVLLAKDHNLAEVEVESKSKSCIIALVLRSLANSQHYSWSKMFLHRLPSMFLQLGEKVS